MSFEFQYPIGYLENFDFDEGTGLIKGELERLPVLVMVQANYCSACSKSKPEFQKLANNGKFHVMTVQIDGERESEQKISTMLSKIIPGINSIPVYVLFVNGKKYIYTGSDRSAGALKQFVELNL